MSHPGRHGDIGPLDNGGTLEQELINILYLDDVRGLVIRLVQDPVILALAQNRVEARG